MKKLCILGGIFLLIVMHQSLKASEPDVPELLTAQTADRNAIGWQWRTASDYKIYPYLKIESDQLFFLDAEGRVISQKNYLPHSKIVTSKNQAFVGFVAMVEPHQVLQDTKENKRIRYHITNFSGEEVYIIQLELPSDNPIPALYLANDGRSVLVDGYQGSVKISGTEGIAVAEIDLFEDDVLDYEKPAACAIADDGEKIAILAQKRPLSFDANASTFISGEPYLFCYSFDGTELLSKPLDLMTASEVAIAPSGDFIIASHYTPESEKKSSLINLNGEVLLEIPTLFRYARFSQDETLLFLADRKSLFKIDVENKSYSTKVLINETENRLVVDIRSASESNDLFVLMAESIFQNRQFEFIEPEVIKLNHNGERIWTLEFKPEKFILPSFYADQNRFSLGFESGYKIYREQRE